MVIPCRSELSAFWQRFSSLRLNLSCNITWISKLKVIYHSFYLYPESLTTVFFLLLCFNCVLFIISLKSTIDKASFIILQNNMSRSEDPNDYVVHDPLLEKGKEKFNKMQAKEKRRQREWAGKSLTWTNSCWLRQLSVICSFFYTDHTVTTEASISQMIVKFFTG